MWWAGVRLLPLGLDEHQVLLVVVCLNMPKADSTASIPTDGQSKAKSKG